MLIQLLIASLLVGECIAAATTMIDDTIMSKRQADLPPLSYHPGNFDESKRSDDDIILLSNGLSAKPIAFAGQYVQLKDGSAQSNLYFHKKPDAAAVFELPDTGGWLYVTNAGTSWKLYSFNLERSIV